MLTTLTGWGRSTYSSALLAAPRSPEELADAILRSDDRGVLVRGLGRSYGDSALNAGGIILDLRHFVDTRIQGTAVKVGAGRDIGSLQADLMTQGLFLPVIPGTAHVTVGGAIANDIHGKNHHSRGSFGNHVKSLTLLDGEGHLRTLSPGDPDSSFFWATVGGVGLTGVILDAELQLMPVSSPRLRVRNQRKRSLDEVMEALREADATSEYTVAWIDSVGLSGPLGRGVVTSADHEAEFTGATPTRPNTLSVPLPPPRNLLGTASVGAFNEAWFRKHPREAVAEDVSPWSFFHPLDRVGRWNLLYGPHGFVQYQVCVPEDGSALIRKILEAFRSIGAPSFLTVLKRFGPGNDGMLSFPQTGWTLAADVPAGNQRLGPTLDALDELVVQAGGRHYLAKDARVSREVIAAEYPRMPEWRAVRQRLDPVNRFRSDLGRRLNLSGRG